MDPVSSDHFSWERASADLEGFARSLGITPSAEHGWSVPSDSHETQPHLNTEQGSTFHSDAFHPSGQQNPDSFYPNFDGSTGYSQASVPQLSDQPGDSFNPYGQSQSAYPGAPNERAASGEPSTSHRYGHYGETGSFDDPSAIRQYDQIHEIVTFDGSTASDPFGQNYPTASFDEPSASYPFGQNYPTASFEQPSASDPCNPYYSTGAVGETSTSHPCAGYESYGVYEPSKSPPPSRVDEPPVLVQTSHARHFDHQKLQALRASLALPFPGILAGKFNDSILSQSFKAFSRSDREVVSRIVDLGKIDHIVDNAVMSMIFDEQDKRILAKSIYQLNTLMIRNNIGEIERPVRQDCFIFKKGKNFHLVNALHEAYSQISQDFDIIAIPLRIVQVFALFYGNPRLSRGNVAAKLGVSKSTISTIVSDCNIFLEKEKSPLSIETQYKRYCLAFNKKPLLS